MLVKGKKSHFLDQSRNDSWCEINNKSNLHHGLLTHGSMVVVAMVSARTDGWWCTIETFALGAWEQVGGSVKAEKIILWRWTTRSDCKLLMVMISPLEWSISTEGFSVIRSIRSIFFQWLYNHSSLSKIRNRGYLCRVNLKQLSCHPTQAWPLNRRVLRLA